MDTLNTPIEMISVCTVDGQLRPLRFRYEDAAHRLYTIRVGEVLTARELNYVGRQCYQFLCRARVDDREQLFELRYAVKTHRWSLFRILN